MAVLILNTIGKCIIITKNYPNQENLENMESRQRYQMVERTLNIAPQYDVLMVPNRWPKANMVSQLSFQMEAVIPNTVSYDVTSSHE